LPGERKRGASSSVFLRRLGARLIGIKVIYAMTGHTFGMIAKTFLSMPKAIGEFIMHRWCEIITVSLIAAAPWLVTTAGAAPISQSMWLQPALTPPVEAVHHHRGRRSGYLGYRGSGFISAGIGAGALLSRFLGTTRPYGYYGYGRGYAYPPSTAYRYRPGHPYEFDRQLSGRD
jgi:hypothetical protein